MSSGSIVASVQFFSNDSGRLVPGTREKLESGRYGTKVPLVSMGVEQPSAAGLGDGAYYSVLACDKEVPPLGIVSSPKSVSSNMMILMLERLADLK